jgi:anti-sigma regulatory factor (Ser/Thr protein kinase)
MPSHLQIPIADVSSIGEARRTVQNLARTAGLDETDAGRAAIVATELATNLAKHAKPPVGVILVAANDGAVEILSIDNGPGMSNVARCFEDGFSTAGTPGNGLGAIRRMSDQIDFYSTSTGTILWVRVSKGGDRTASPPRQTLRSAGMSIPAPGETICGDCWRIAKSDDGRIAVMIADGLGHGPLAAEASQAANQCFDANPFARPDAQIHNMHAAISGTRGAAVATLCIDPAAGKLSYAGVGNVAGTLMSPVGSSRGLFSHNGIVGHQLRKVQVFEYPWSSTSMLVLHSDGLQTRWTFAPYPGLSRRHPAIVGAALYRDFRRGRDDVSVVIVGPPEFGA